MITHRLGERALAECPVCRGPMTATRSGLVCSSGQPHGLVPYPLAAVGEAKFRDFEKAGYMVSYGATGVQMGNALRKLLRSA